MIRIGMNKTLAIGSWEDLIDFIETRPIGVSELDHIGSYCVLPNRIDIALASLISPEVAPYLRYYNIMTSKWNKDFIYKGGFQDQPNVLIDAFSIIEGEISQYEKRARLLALEEARSRNNG